MVTPLFMLALFAGTFGLLWLYALLGNVFLEPRFRSWRMRAAWVTPFTLGFMLTQYFCSPFSRGYVRMALCLVFSFWMFRGGAFKKLMVFVLYFLMLMCGEILTTAAIGMLGVTQSLDVNGFSVCVGAIFWLLFQLIRGIKKTIDSRIGWRTWVKILYCAGAVFAMVTQFWYIYYRYIGGGDARNIFRLSVQDVISLILMILQFGVIYVLFSIVHEMNRNMEALSQARMDEMKACHDLEQSRIMLESAEEIHRLQHDMKNHLLAIDALSGDVERQHAYIRHLTSDLMQPGATAQCGNRLIDSLISFKMSVMRQRGIRCDLTLSPMPDALNLDDTRLCSLVTNALDNAIEACGRLPADQTKWIGLTVRLDAGGLFLKVTNPYPNARRTAADALKKNASRFSKAGTGIRNMRRAARAMGGEMTLCGNEKDNELNLSVFIPNSIPVSDCVRTGAQPEARGAN